MTTEQTRHLPAVDHSGGPGLTRQAISATLHCLTGCAIGEVLGMVLATWWGWGNAATIVLSIVLAFAFGYSLTMRPVRRAGLSFPDALRVAFAADTVSIAVMELVDNAFIVAVPGALAAGLTDVLFWWSLALSLLIAFAVTVPANRFLIARGMGHARVHGSHHWGLTAAERVLLTAIAHQREHRGDGERAVCAAHCALGHVEPDQAKCRSGPPALVEFDDAAALGAEERLLPRPVPTDCVEQEGEARCRDLASRGHVSVGGTGAVPGFGLRRHGVPPWYWASVTGPAVAS